VKTTLVVCDVLVTDKQGRPVEGLTRDDFIVSEDGAPQRVETFAPGDAASVRRTIDLIIYYRGTQFPLIKTSVAAQKTLIYKLKPNDRMALVTDDVELVVDFTRDKEKLKKKLDDLENKTKPGGFFNISRRFGKSAQYSALMATLNEAFDEEDERPIIIFQTDGDELPLLRDSVIIPELPPNLPAAMREETLRNFARMQQYFRNNVRGFSLKDIYLTAEKSRATIYTVVPGYRFIGLGDEDQIVQLKAHRMRSLEAWNAKPDVRRAQEENLNKLPPEVLRFQIEQVLKVQTALAGVADITGGWTDFLETPEQASDIYSRILSDINRRYLVGYYPTNSEPDGKRRRVVVEVRNHPEYVVWGRKSYLAATN
jgi:VWFA-related protein